MKKGKRGREEAAMLALAKEIARQRGAKRWGEGWKREDVDKEEKGIAHHRELTRAWEKGWDEREGMFQKTYGGVLKPTAHNRVLMDGVEGMRVKEGREMYAAKVRVLPLRGERVKVDDSAGSFIDTNLAMEGVELKKDHVVSLQAMTLERAEGQRIRVRILCGPWKGRYGIVENWVPGLHYQTVKLEEPDEDEIGATRQVGVSVLDRGIGVPRLEDDPEKAVEWNRYPLVRDAEMVDRVGDRLGEIRDEIADLIQEAVEEVESVGSAGEVDEASMKRLAAFIQTLKPQVDKIFDLVLEDIEETGTALEDMVEEMKRAVRGLA